MTARARIRLGALAFAPALALTALAPQAAWAGALAGPILDTGRSVVLEDVVQLPATGAAPRTRINVLREAPDGSGRLFVNDLRGPLHVIDGATVSTYLDMDALRASFITSPGLAMGFVSFAFHPDFASNGLFYTVHTESPGGTPTHGPAEPATISNHSILTEWTATNPAADAFSGSSREILRIAATSHFHNLGEIAFDPNAGPGHPDYGLLYLANGDYGAVNSLGEPEQIQRLDTLYGALLRIDPLGGDGSPYSYGIPADNPYVSDGDPDTFGEILAHGFRNAHRIHWSRQGLGGPFVTDIGQGNLEEVNVLVAGQNYGWPEREGSYALDPDADPETVFALPPNDASFGFTYPVAQYDHEEGRAIAGAILCEQDPASSLHGKLVFSDIVNGRIFYAHAGIMMAADDGDPETTAPVAALTLVHEGSEKTLLQVVRDELGQPTLARVDLRLASDEAGTLYLMTKRDGFVRRLVPDTVAVPALPGAGAIVLATALVAGAWWGLRGARRSGAPTGSSRSRR